MYKSLWRDLKSVDIIYQNVDLICQHQEFQQILHQSVFRVLLRPTALYMNLLRVTQQPTACRNIESTKKVIGDLLAQDILFLEIERYSFTEEERFTIQQLEINDLINQDIPAFHCRVDRVDTLLCSNMLEINNHIKQSTSVTNFIVEAIKELAENRNEMFQYLSSIATEPVNEFNFTADSCLSIAIQLGKSVLISIKEDQSKLKSLNSQESILKYLEFYEGISGKMLFCSALYKFVPKEMKEIFYQPLMTLHNEIMSYSSKILHKNTTNCGTVTGISSIIYCLLKTREFLGMDLVPVSLLHLLPNEAEIKQMTEPDILADCLVLLFVCCLLLNL
jgi:hypothetical protein